MRGNGIQIVEVDKTREAIVELLDGVNISKLKSAEAHDMLEYIYNIAVDQTHEHAEEFEQVEGPEQVEETEEY